MSQIHVSLGPTSVHLLLTGLVGMILGRRACVAIPVGVTLQAALLGHGSMATIGVNSCVMIVPTLLARPMFQALMHGWRMRLGDGFLAIACLLFPLSILIAGPVVFSARRVHQRMNLTTAFDAGFLVGAATVFLTSLLNSLVLAFGGVQDWTAVAILSLAAHLPVALIEGVILGTVVDVLMKVKPALLMPAAVTESFTPPEISHPAALPTAPAPR